MSPNTDPWMNPEHWKNDMNTQDREFWKGYNRRKHAYFMDHKAEQRERFREECERIASEPSPKKITGKVLEITR